MTTGVPTTYEEAINSLDKKKWIQAMKRKIDSFHENKVYTFAKG